MTASKVGFDVVKKDKLTADQVAEGHTIYFSGTNSRGKWACPAIISDVDPKSGTFHVISLDDMQRVDQAYPIESPETDDADNVRANMEPHPFRMACDYVRNTTPKRHSYFRALLKAYRTIRDYNKTVAAHKSKAKRLHLL